MLFMYNLFFVLMVFFSPSQSQGFLLLYLNLIFLGGNKYHTNLWSVYGMKWKHFVPHYIPRLNSNWHSILLEQNLVNFAEKSHFIDRT